VSPCFANVCRGGLQLKRPRSESRASKAEAVEKLIARLGLTSCADVKIGDPLTKGISGGQAKVRNQSSTAASLSKEVVRRRSHSL
jgi:hypothetical protein